MKHNFDARRGFLKSAAAAGLALSGPAHVLAAADKAARAGDPWNEAARIARRLADPVKFRKADYLVTDFGAAPCKLVPVKAWVSFEDQASLQTPAPDAPDCYPALKAAIGKCHAEGGGRVVIPKGDWYCAGPIVLLSNVNVHLASGAHVYFSNDPADYAKYGDVDCGANGKLVVSRWQSN
ncbi:MAG: endopolygalacturonase, partial [Massilia sp.]|nr:endopolygalacturonase [Massilia sp.]